MKDRVKASVVFYGGFLVVVIPELVTGESNPLTDHPFVSLVVVFVTLLFLWLVVSSLSGSRE